MNPRYSSLYWMSSKRRSLQARLLFLVLGMLTAWLPLGYSSTIITQPFDSPVGGLPPDWIVKKRGADAPDSVAQIVTSGTSGRLLIQRPSTANGGGSTSQAAVFYTGSTGEVDNGKIGDFTGSLIVTLAPTSGGTTDYRGIVARAQTTTYQNFGGYYLAFSPTGIGIWLNPTSHVANGTQLAYSAFSESLVSNIDYRFEFSVLGSVLKAELWSLTGESPLASVTVDVLTQFPAETYYTDGYFGLRAGYGNTNGTYFRDLNLVAVPEPRTTMLMLLLTGGALTFRSLRNRIL